MRIELKTSAPVQVIAKTEVPWTMEGGRSGITYRLGVLLDDDVEKIKCVDRDTYESIQKGQFYNFVGDLNVNNGRVSEWRVSAAIPVVSDKK